MTEAERLAQGQLQNLFRAGRKRDLAGCDFFSGADDPDNLGADALHGYVEGFQNPRGQSLFLAEKAEQDVLGADVVVLQGSCFLLGEDDYLTCAFCKSLEQKFLATSNLSVWMSIGYGSAVDWNT